MWIVLLKIVLREMRNVRLNFLNAFNSSFDSFTMSKTTLIHSKEFITIGCKHLSQESVIIEAFSISVDVVHHSFLLNMSLNRISICLNSNIIFSLETIGFRPNELFIVDEFIVILPIFKCDPVSIFVLHILTSHITCNSSQHNPTASNLFFFFKFNFLHSLGNFVWEVFVTTLGHLYHLLQLEKSVDWIQSSDSFASWFSIVGLVELVVLHFVLHKNVHWFLILTNNSLLFIGHLLQDEFVSLFGSRLAKTFHNLVSIVDRAYMLKKQPSCLFNWCGQHLLL